MKTGYQTQGTKNNGFSFYTQQNQQGYSHLFAFFPIEKRKG